MLSASSATSVAIVGAGAMGCLFAARLAEQGVNVTVVDVDRERLSVMSRDGITLIDDKGSRTLPVRASVASELTGPFDLLVLFTKGTHSASAIKSVTHLAATKPIALTLQNGIGNAALLSSAFGADHVLQGTAHVPADLSGPASVVTHGFGSLELGGLNAASQAYAPPVAALLQAAAFKAHVSNDINSTVWEKLAFNAALNAVGMICQVANAGVDNEYGRRLAAKVVEETANVAAAGGIKIDRQQILKTIDSALREHHHHKASMLQDRERGRQTEIDMINGAVAREGKRLNVATPVCDTLTDLVKIIELAAKA
jgi:2-dehydropantoate 2-reductase